METRQPRHPMEAKAAGSRQQRLQHQLEVQSQQIERVFSEHRIPAQVAGGMVQPRSVRFDLSTQLAQGWEHLKALKQELMLALGVPEISLIRENGQLRLHVGQPDDPPVALLDLLPLLDELPPVTATLGLEENGRPLLLDFHNPAITHVLVTGGPEAGKTILLRTLAVSLALTNRQSQVQLAVMAGAGENGRSGYDLLAPLAYLPHMLAEIGTQLEESEAILDFLVGEMKYRQQQTVERPAIVVLIDNAIDLWMAGGDSVQMPLTALLQRGAEVGIHLVLSTRQAETVVLENSLRANLSVRLVGQVSDGQQAIAATGSGDSQAEYLLGQGDFLAVISGETTHFQGAYIGDYDLHLSLTRLHRQRPPVLLAQPLSLRSSLASKDRQPSVQRFQFDGRIIALDDEPDNLPQFLRDDVDEDETELTFKANDAADTEEAVDTELTYEDDEEMVGGWEDYQEDDE